LKFIHRNWSRLERGYPGLGAPGLTD
jgi:hypothetical protein